MPTSAAADQPLKRFTASYTPRTPPWCFPLAVSTQRIRIQRCVSPFCFKVLLTSPARCCPRCEGAIPVQLDHLRCASRPYRRPSRGWLCGSHLCLHWGGHTEPSRPDRTSPRAMQRPQCSDHLSAAMPMATRCSRVSLTRMHCGCLPSEARPPVTWAV
jgi:hypothetical protein